MVMKHQSFARSLIQPFVVAAILAIGLRHTVQAYSIPTASMSPALEPGDHILVTPYALSLGRTGPERGDVVVFRSPANGELLIKRVIAVPGDLIEVRNHVLINGQQLEEPYLAAGIGSGTITPVLLAPETYFVMGDSRNDSLDSRAWGTVSGEAIIGRARLIFWSDGEITNGAIARAASRLGEVSTGNTRIQWHRLLQAVR